VAETRTRAPAGPGGPGSPGSTVTASSQRRFARRQWSRRWLRLRYVVVAVLGLALLVVGVWSIWFSSLLAVEQVEVAGADVLSEQEVRDAASVPVGDPVARIDLDAVRARVEALAVVRSADVTRAWPDGVRVEVEERVAVAVVRIGSTLRGMDAEGVVFRDYQETPTALPRVDALSGVTSEALREGAAVVAALPEGLAADVDYVEVGTVDQIRLLLRDGREVVWGSSADAEQKARVLEVLLEQDGRVLDVSVPATPTTRS
jgi:cell division septal protein FtsQ